MPNPSQDDTAESIQKQQRLDADRLLERHETVHIVDLTVNYRLEESSVVNPALLDSLSGLGVLFRLNSPKKWRLALVQDFLPESARRWLGVAGLDDLA